MRKLYLLSIILLISTAPVLGQSTYSENFDTADNWAGGSMTGYNAKTYTNSADPANDQFSTNSAVRETDYVNSGAYAFRVDDNGGFYLRYECEETVSSFSIYMARWDNSPVPSVTIRYSTNSGTSYTDIETIDGSYFTGDKVYKQYSHSFGTAISPATGEKVYIEFYTNSGERMLYDDFEITYGSTGGNVLPIISNIVQTPSADITSSTTVSVSADVTDSDGTISDVELHWGTTSGSLTNTIAMSNTSGDTYVTDSDIPAQSDGTVVYYEVYATDNDGGERTSAEQNYTVTDPMTTTLPYSEPFDTDLSGVYTYNAAGQNVWTYFSSSARANGFNGDNPEEDWMILPGINLNSYSDEVMSFTTYAQFGVVDENNYLKLFYSTNYPGLGDPNGAGVTWTELSYTQPAGINSSTEESAFSGNIDLSGISGTSVYIAFKYFSTDSPTRWRVDDISIQESAPKVINSITVSQASTSSVTTGSVDQEILSIQFNVTGTDGTLNLNSIQVTAQNTSDADITANGVKLYRTSEAVFATDNQLGTAQSISSGLVTFSSLAYDLPSGDTYVWITYDISASATVGNTVDAKIASDAIDVAGTDYPAAEQNPTGNREIVSTLADHVVIAEVYGGGGNSGAPYTHDYIVLFNPTASAVDLSAWSIQYASSTGTFNSKTDLAGSINAGSYYMIQCAAGTSGNGDPLPVTPNVSGSINMSASNGKVALANDQELISGLGDANVVDYVGYGSANEYEGSAAAPGLSNTSSVRRKDNSGNNTYGSNGNGYDTDDNSNDFYLESDLVSSPPLPVELISFAAEVIGNRVNLSWSTATEVNNYGFEIERLEKEWIKIGFVLGNGNSNTPSNYKFADGNINGSGVYFYRLKQIDTDGQFEYSEIIEVNISLPAEFSLEQNYPNPFNPSTVIRFSLPQQTRVRLAVYNTLGQEVRVLVNKEMEAGDHSVALNASNFTSGIYFYRLETQNFTSTKKMILLR